MGDTTYETGQDGRLTDDALRQIASCCNCVGCQLEVCTEVSEVAKELLELREQRRATKAPAGDNLLPGEPLRVEANATPEGIPVKLTDGAGREIGTAVVVDGRIQATVTDRLIIERLRHDGAGISMGYRVVIEPEPAIPVKR